MGKNYQSLKKELAEELARNKVRALLVVNDQLIRQKYFAEANDIIQKMDRLERKIQVFHSSDQKLFDQWYRLTFRNDQALVDRTQSEFRQLARFHNWIVATAHMLDIELPDAYLLMKEEERRYKHGTDEDRRQIDLDRDKRDQFIEGDSRAKYDDAPDFEAHDSEEDENNPLDQILDRLEELLLSNDREILATQQLRMDRLSELTDDEFAFALKEQETSFLLFHVSLSWGERKSDYSFFLRLWRLFSKEQKTFFTEVYESVTGQSLTELVLRLGGESDSSEETEAEEEDEEEAFQFREEFINPKRSSSRHQHFAPGEEERFKQLYRKLIRRLHPDAHGTDRTEGWMKRFWESVQKAYNSKDLLSLDRILKLTLLRTNALNQLTVDEICEASHWLEKDLSNLEKEERQLKKSMAWGFSERKEFSGISRKIKKEFEETLTTILFQIREIKDQHRFLEAMASQDDFDRDQIYRKKRTQKNQSRRRRQQRRRDRDDDNQESFSF